MVRGMIIRGQWFWKPLAPDQEHQDTKNAFSGFLVLGTTSATKVVSPGVRPWYAHMEYA